MPYNRIRNRDPELYEAMRRELERQRNSLEMIPSENFASEEVMEAMGSVLINKYSEGYPGRRYYGGNQFIDEVERLAVMRIRKLFGVPHANVQPYSGSPANLAVYLATCEPGAVIMGLNLPDGGHLTHGWKSSASGILFKSVPYHVLPDGSIDIDEVKRLANKHRPRLIWVGATAYTLELPFKQFGEIADAVGAYLCADISHVSGLIIAGVHNSPVPHCDIVVTTTHKTFRGPRGAVIMVTDKGARKDPELPEKIDKAVFPGLQGGPHDHKTAAIAIAALEAMSPEFRRYCEQVVSNAKALAEGLKKNGLRLVANGTANHMVLVDLTQFSNGFGIFAQEALDAIGITVNKNTIPGEPASPFYPSGIRLGTPALTTRGMREGEMSQIADLIAAAIRRVAHYRLPENKAERQAHMEAFRNSVCSDAELMRLREKVLALCSRFPLYQNLE